MNSNHDNNMRACHCTLPLLNPGACRLCSNRIELSEFELPAPVIIPDIDFKVTIEENTSGEYDDKDAHGYFVHLDYYPWESMFGTIFL